MSADVFDSALELEETHSAEGHQQGVIAGKRAGLVEGRELGLQKGWEIGQEVGFYAGCVQVWRQLQRKDPAAFPHRADKGMATLENLTQTFPLTDPKDERMQSMMEDMRGKFKAVAAMLGVLEDYFTSSTVEPLAF
ncbi:hypothetical protein ABBQ32_012890 [Trebouxia sp. C0010 RCD-2024]